MKGGGARAGRRVGVGEAVPPRMSAGLVFEPPGAPKARRAASAVEGTCALEGARVSKGDGQVVINGAVSQRLGVRVDCLGEGKG